MQDLTARNSTILEAIRNLKGQGFIDFKSFSDDWVIKMWHGSAVHFLFANKFDRNARSSTDIATDKVATYELLADQSIPAVPHVLLTTPIAATPDRSLLDKLFGEYHDLVIKPTNGSRGNDVVRCDSIEEVLRVTKNTSVPSWSASPFVEVVKELRLVILNDKLELAYEKHDPPIIGRLKMFNLHLGAKASPIDIRTIPDEYAAIAKHAMKAIGLDLGAVDIVIDQGGQPLVLEINSGFSLEHYAAMSPENRREVVTFYERVIRSLFET